VAFRYGKQPGPEELRAIDALREVYGIRQVRFNEKESSVRVEFDASRMNEDTVAALLRRAGIDLKEKLALA
jgi:copper chaperone CopZ